MKPDGEDKDVKREMQMASLQHDIATAPKLKDLVLYELGNGVRPEWIAVKYGHLGATLERVRSFKAAIDKQREKKLERQQESTGGDSPPLEGREVVNGT